MDLFGGTASSWGVEFHILLTARGEYYHVSHLIPRTSVGLFLIYLPVLNPPWGYTGRIMRGESPGICGFCFQAFFVSCSCDGDGTNPLGMFFVVWHSVHFRLLTVSGVHVDPQEEHSAVSSNATRLVTVTRESILNFFPLLLTQKISSEQRKACACYTHQLTWK